MRNYWQDVRGNYPPANTFIRDNVFRVLTKDIEQIDTGLWQWKEYHMPLDIYESIVATITNDSSLPVENQAGLMDLAELADENAEAILGLAEIIGEMEG